VQKQNKRKRELVHYDLITKHIIVSFATITAQTKTITKVLKTETKNNQKQYECTATNQNANILITVNVPSLSKTAATISTP